MIAPLVINNDIDNIGLTLKNLATERPAIDSARFQEVCGAYNQKAIEVARSAMQLLTGDKASKERAFLLLEAVHKNAYSLQIDKHLFEIYTKEKDQETEIINYLVNFLQTEVDKCPQRETLFREDPWQLLLLRTIQNGYLRPAFTLMEASCKKERSPITIAQYTVISCLKSFDKFSRNLIKIHRCFYFALTQKYPNPPKNKYAKQGVCQLLFLRSISAYLASSIYPERERTPYIEAGKLLQKSFSDTDEGNVAVNSASKKFIEKFFEVLENKTP